MHELYQAILSLIIALYRGIWPGKITRNDVSKALDQLFSSNFCAKDGPCVEPLETIRLFVATNLSPGDIASLSKKIRREWLVDSLEFIKYYEKAIIFSNGHVTIVKIPMHRSVRVLFFFLAVIIMVLSVWFAIFCMPFIPVLLWQLIHSIIDSPDSVLKLISENPRLFFGGLLSAFLAAFIAFGFPALLFRMFFVTVMALKLEARYEMFYKLHK